MKAKKLGDYVRVYVSPTELDAFSSRWPCSGMEWPSRGLRFEFSVRNGDLVDITGQLRRYNDVAVTALADDAQAYARKLGLLPN